MAVREPDWHPTSFCSSSSMATAHLNRMLRVDPNAVQALLRVSRAAAVLTALVLTVMVVASTGRGSVSTPVKSRTIDRTFLCTNAAQFGVRQINVVATSGFRDSGRWKWLASASIANTRTQPTKLKVGTTNTNWGVAVAAGAGAIANDPAAPGPKHAYLSFWSTMPERCRSVPSAHVPLPARGGDLAGPLSETYECAGSRRTYVRVRAVFRVPTALRLNRTTGNLTASAPVREGYVAARTESGALLAFARVSETGKARILTAPSCAPD
jgi:hypothetical protein